jgi:hypothetical protein
MMAERMSTATRMDRARDNHAVTRTVNGHRKRKQRTLRDIRMKELLHKGSFPYTPAIMSWLSEKLEKPASRITAAEADALKK